MSDQTNAAYEFIKGHELVLSQFGVWPSFHDGEVHRIVLDRTPGKSPSSLPTIEIWIRGWNLKTRSGQCVFADDAVVHFLFEEVSEVELEGFNHQNVLSALNLSMASDSLLVELEHCFLFCGGFRARRARVMSIRPFDRAANS